MAFDEIEKGMGVAHIATLDAVRRELCKYYAWMFAGAPRNGGPEVKTKIAELELRLFEMMKKEV